ncbi:MAG: flagellar assembly protein FliH [Oxalobacteraceae bacterium]|nr:flagellar assembly protein FliH [Oxalobacteraceae bacterium]
MASFGNDKPVSPPDLPEQIALPTAEQIAAIHETARLQGYADGLREGHAAGLIQGRSKAAAERDLLLEIAAAFKDQVARADELIAKDLMDLALDLSKAMLKNALKIRPELVLPIVSEAIHYLPSLAPPALLFLNHDDATLVREQLGTALSEAGWRIIDEPSMQRGGCRIETGSNQIDATTESRWLRIAGALDSQTDWLAP